jgi:hypothetical protein
MSVKKPLLIIILFIAGVFLCSFTDQGEEQQDYNRKEHFEGQHWYRSFLLLLSRENRIDSADAKMIKALSSSMDRSNEPIEQTIKRYGNIEEADIKLMCKSKENNDSTICVFTQASVYIDLFIYHPTTNALTRNIKNGVIVVTGAEELVLKQNNDSLMVLWAKRKNEQENMGWTKYFCYNKRAKSFYHLKNCRVVNNQEECKTIQQWTY